VYHDGKVLRTFIGHSRAVKDVTFSNDGRRFLSAGFDRQIKLWDTETGPSLFLVTPSKPDLLMAYVYVKNTGQCLQAFSNGQLPNVVKFHPDNDKQNVFLAGMHNKKIVQVSRPSTPAVRLQKMGVLKQGAHVSTT
jgi:pre-mRNA-processing factor 17